MHHDMLWYVWKRVYKNLQRQGGHENPRRNEPKQINQKVSKEQTCNQDVIRPIDAKFVW